MNINKGLKYSADHEWVRIEGNRAFIGISNYAQIALGDSQIMFSEECQEYGGKSPQTLGGSPVTLYVYVEDVDAFFERALAAGATELHPVRDQFYGDRSGQLMDPFGHVWSIASPKENVSPEEIQKRMEALCVSQK